MCGSPAIRLPLTPRRDTGEHRALRPRAATSVAYLDAPGLGLLLLGSRSVASGEGGEGRPMPGSAAVSPCRRAPSGISPSSTPPHWARRARWGCGGASDHGVGRDGSRRGLVSGLLAASRSPRTKVAQSCSPDIGRHTNGAVTTCVLWVTSRELVHEPGGWVHGFNALAGTAEGSTGSWWDVLSTTAEK